MSLIHLPSVSPVKSAQDFLAELAHEETPPTTTTLNWLCCQNRNSFTIKEFRFEYTPTSHLWEYTQKPLSH